MSRLAIFARRALRGLWRSADFRRIFASATITAFGAQVTNLALPLTAALLLSATPLEMGALIALETLPFALVSLHAGVMLDRVRKLPVVIACGAGRGIALASIPVAAWLGVLTIQHIFVVGFVCGLQNVIGGAAYQVLLAQLAGRRRLVEANAKVALGETSAALVGPGLAGLLIQLLTAPFAIALDAVSFVASAWMLSGVRAPRDQPLRVSGTSVGHEIMEGLRLVARNPTLRSLAILAGSWQLLHNMQLAVLILYATRDLALSPGAIGVVFMCGGAGCMLAAASAERLSVRFGVGPVIIGGLGLTAVGWLSYALVRGTPLVAAITLGAAMLVFDFGAVLFGIAYLSLRQAITPDRLLGRMTATMRFLTVASAPVGALAGGAIAAVIGLRATIFGAATLGMLLVAVAAAWSPVRRYRELPQASEALSPATVLRDMHGVELP
jgi:Transmembrane secretion effector